MSMRLVCDHCENIIQDASFVETTRMKMTQNIDDPVAGIQRAGATDTSHYHEVCADARDSAANDLKGGTASTKESIASELTSDHPLTIEANAVAAAEAERDRISRGGEMPVVEPGGGGMVTTPSTDTLPDLPPPAEPDAGAPIDEEQIEDAPDLPADE